MIFSGEPKDIDELLLRLAAKHVVRFKPREDQPLKHPFNVMSRLGIERIDADLMLRDLRKAECVDPKGMPCDDEGVPCRKMWPFKHRYAPRNGEGPFDLYIKVASTTKRNPATGKEELLVIYVISFHEDE